LIGPPDQDDFDAFLQVFPRARQVGGELVGVPNPLKMLETKLGPSVLRDYFISVGLETDYYVPVEFSPEVFDKDVAKYRKKNCVCPLIEMFHEKLVDYFSDVRDTCSPCFEPSKLISQIPGPSSSGFEAAHFGITKGAICDAYELHPGSSGLDDALRWILHNPQDTTYASIAAKDELRAASKVYESKVRSFLVMSFRHYVGSLALYFDHHDVLSEKFRRERRFGNSTNVYTSYGADRYHLELERVLGLLMDTVASRDAVKWDGTLLASLLEVCCHILWLMFLPKHRTYNNWVRHLYITRWLINTAYLYNGRLWFKERGMPSGAFHTLMINTIYHIAICLLEHDIFPLLVSLILGDDRVSSGELDVELERKLYEACGVEIEYVPGFAFLQCDHYVVNGYHVIVPSVDKVVASLAWRSRCDFPGGMVEMESAYVRCCAMRNLLWPVPASCNVVEGAISYLLDRLVDGIPFSKTQTYLRVRNNYLTDLQLHALWFVDVRREGLCYPAALLQFLNEGF